VKRGVKREWERLYRAAVLESDPRSFPKRIAAAQAAILERSRKLNESPTADGTERTAIARALHILTLLAEAEPGDAPRRP
jgi:hypothetical protein